MLFNGEWLDLTSKINLQRSILNKDPIELKDVSMYSDSKSKFLLSLNQSVVDNKIYHNINVYMADGSEVLKVTDIQESSTTFKRIIGNISNTITNKKVVYSTQINVNLDRVKLNKGWKRYQRNLNTNDPYIGTLDTETYRDSQSNTSKVYALGFYTKKFETETFYIEKDLDSDKLILRCIYSLLQNKYNNYTFYVHNMGRFDIVFILKVLINANINTNKYGL